MTQEREELLISDVAETKGMLNRFLIEWDARKKDLASCADLEAVDSRLTTHIGDGRHRAGSAAVWVASVAAVFASLAAILGVKI
jgi:hypothetical protein